MAEWQTRMFKGHVRKSVGSSPTACTREKDNIADDIPPQLRAPIKKGVFLWEKGARKFICVRLRRANKHKCSVRRNGRRADSRGMFERVWVQVPPPAPNKNNPNHFDSDYFCLYSYFFSFHFSLLLFIRIIFYQKTCRQIL